MFLHRLGLALGKTLGELAAMPYAEYRSWKAYYKMEPFGWQDREYRTGAMMAMVYNTHAKNAKKVDEFMRDPEKAIFEQINQAKAREKWLKASKRERMKMLSASFGSMGIKAKVKN